MPAQRDANGRFIKGSGSAGGGGIALKVTTEFSAKPVTDAAERVQYKNLRHAAASISKDVKSTLQKADGPSAAGTPPHTHRGAFLRRAVRFDANKDSALIGPQASIVGEAGAAHEFGGEFRGTEFPERSYMLPGLERNQDRFARDWAGSIGG